MTKRSIPSLLLVWALYGTAFFTLFQVLRPQTWCALHRLRASPRLEGSEVPLLYPNTGRSYNLSVDFHAGPYEEIPLYVIEGDDPVSGASIRINVLPSFHVSTAYLYAEPLLQPEAASLRWHFCSACRQELAAALEGQDVGVAVLYNVQTDRLQGISAGQTLLLDGAELQISRIEREPTGPCYQLWLHYTVDATI